MKFKSSKIGWIICIVAAIFYCYEYILRITPSIMIPELMHDFHADATKLGIIAACYYFVYTPMQIIVGLLLDLYGPRKILTLAAITCTVGNYLFSISNVLLIIYSNMLKYAQIMIIVNNRIKCFKAIIII